MHDVLVYGSFAMFCGIVLFVTILNLGTGPSKFGL